MNVGLGHCINSHPGPLVASGQRRPGQSSDGTWYGSSSSVDVTCRFRVDETCHGTRRSTSFGTLVRSGKRQVYSASVDVNTVFVVEARSCLSPGETATSVSALGGRSAGALQVEDLGDLHSPFYISSHTSDL